MTDTLTTFRLRMESNDISWIVQQVMLDSVLQAYIVKEAHKFYIE
jgi:hypothetical protein